MNEQASEDLVFGQVIFVGQTLGPFFLEDPRTGNIASFFEFIRDLDVNNAAKEWPFVQDAEALPLFEAMKQGLDDGTDSDDLMWEYRRLFVGPGVKPAPPWGSVYTDHECVVFGQSTLALRSWLGEKGITRLGDTNSPEDHIGLLLLLMSWIAENKPKLLEEFLRLHLLTWSSHFLEQLAAASRNSFYAGLAGLTKTSLEGIQQEMGIVVEYPRYYR